jgi:hypothetical protein
LTEWSVRNLEEIRWRRLPGLGTGTRPEQDEPWEQIGIALRYLEPRETLAMYHRENDQEDGVGVEEATDDPDVAYGRFGGTETVPYGGWLRGS